MQGGAVGQGQILAQICTAIVFFIKHNTFFGYQDAAVKISIDQHGVEILSESAMIVAKFFFWNLARGGRVVLERVFHHLLFG